MSHETPGDTERANRLGSERSLYLRQHAANPVHWFPWCDEAFETARREDKPVLLSVGYSACHWCHVMARESFGNAEIARQLNEGFVCVKVDREERPDVDAVYMAAVQSMTGSGGWPLTVFLTPEREPFYGGTYFPPEDRPGRAGLPAVLRAVREAWTSRRDGVHGAARQVIEAIGRQEARNGAAGGVPDEFVGSVTTALAGLFDMTNAGFGGAPKFPQAPVLDWLLRVWARTGDLRAHFMVHRALRRMADGGICDQLGGGFHRYAVDQRWAAPHFEKMLYDNAQLIGLYADAARAFGRPGLRRVAEAAGAWLLREMRAPDGTFWAAQAADTEGVEGAFYTWRYMELLDVLGEDDGELVAAALGATAEGNWEEGRNVLRRQRSAAELAELFHVGEGEARAKLADGTARLLKARADRPAPEVDEKVLADWNALTVSGLVRLRRAGADASWLDAARTCAGRLVGLACGGASGESAADYDLRHAYYDGAGGPAGLLADHALLGEACLDLYEQTFDIVWLRRARALADRVLADFAAPDGVGFVESGRGSESLVAQVSAAVDQPTPCGASAACTLLARLGPLTGHAAYTEAARRGVEASVTRALEAPTTAGRLLSAALLLTAEPREFVLVGLRRRSSEWLLATADEFYLPEMARAGAPSGSVEPLSGEVPLLEGRRALHGLPTAYVCSGGTCREPVQNPVTLREQLRELVPEPPRRPV